MGINSIKMKIFSYSALVVALFVSDSQVINAVKIHGSDDRLKDVLRAIAGGDEHAAPAYGSGGGSASSSATAPIIIP